MPQKPESRCSGILLHITSLPSKFGVGDFGPAAFEFVDSLEQAGQTLWQILPINPPSFGNSPYSCTSAFAISPLFASPELMLRDGLLEDYDLESVPEFSSNRVQYSFVLDFKTQLLSKSYDRFKENIDKDEFKKLRERIEYLKETSFEGIDKPVLPTLGVMKPFTSMMSPLKPLEQGQQ